MVNFSLRSAGGADLVFVSDMEGPKMVAGNLIMAVVQGHACTFNRAGLKRGLCKNPCSRTRRDMAHNLRAWRNELTAVATMNNTAIPR